MVVIATEVTSQEWGNLIGQRPFALSHLKVAKSRLRLACACDRDSPATLTVKISMQNGDFRYIFGFVFQRFLGQYWSDLNK